MRLIPDENSRAAPLLASDEAEVVVCSFTYGERGVVLPDLSDALQACGCWLLGRRSISVTGMEYQFEVQLRLAFELYAALIESGLELTRGSHRELTGLCTVRRHNPRPKAFGRVVTVRLEVHFLEEAMTPAPRSGGYA